MQPNSEGSAPQPTTAGAWLKNARQQRGLHIAALAVMLKVPQAKLEALEADRFDLLPDATFARALATAVCRALKVDSGPVLALLLVAAAAIYWVPAGWLPERGESTATPAFPASAPVSVTAASGPVVEFVPAPEAASVPASAAPVAVAPSSPAVVASAPLQIRDVAPPPAAAAATGPALRVTAMADSWIEVVDAKGQVLLSRVLRQGEQQEYSGAAPYKVRVGNVSGTRLEWRGSVFDLHDRATNNVARLELN